MAAVAGCQQDSSAASALDLGFRKKSNENQEGLVRESELRAYCPRVSLREGTAVYRSFERKAEDDPTKLIYQASISEATRSCTYAPGTITVNVALAGKVVPGPLAKAGPVTMPIRVVATRGTEVLYSQLHDYQVVLDSATGAAQFIFNDPAVTVPSGTDGQVQIYAGYDEGPVKKAQ
ncbi:MAG: hypothetical protein KF723_02135 [Rhizobiaceae bacterium]|nr:hypothetical protein [Rhizobiaceae bacterium]